MTRLAVADQYKSDFPSMEAAKEFRDAIASLTGICRKETKLSEQHLMIYHQRAKDYPCPHKDRCASGITAGFPITLPAETVIYLFPEMGRGGNLNEKASCLDLTTAEDSRDLYSSEHAIRIDQEFGDLVVFAGTRWARIFSIKNWTAQYDMLLPLGSQPSKR